MKVRSSQDVAVELAEMLSAIRAMGSVFWDKRLSELLSDYERALVREMTKSTPRPKTKTSKGKS